MDTKKIPVSYTPPYIAKPPSGKGPGLLVLHAWWGLNPFIKGLCDRLAGEGFVTLAPDLYYGRTAQTIAEAETMSSSLQMPVAAKEVAAAAAALRALCGAEQTGISAIGFSMGGAWGLWLASMPTARVNAVAAFYGLRSGDFSQSQAVFQVHLAEKDVFEPPEDVQEMRTSLASAGREAEFFTYPGTTHWFFESDRPDAYNPEAAALAWSRTLTFLKQHAVVA